MQDAVQYGAVEASSPPTPPKRFGRKTVVALAALGLAGVAALSLGPQKKTATGLVVSPGRPLCLKPGQAWNGWTGTSTQTQGDSVTLRRTHLWAQTSPPRPNRRPMRP